MQTSVVNNHTITYRPISPADNRAQLELNCSGYSDYYLDLNSVRLLLRIKVVKTDCSDILSAKPYSWLYHQLVTFNDSISQ